jgi:hypothetical protein
MVRGIRARWMPRVDRLFIVLEEEESDDGNETEQADKEGEGDSNWAKEDQQIQ